jgi:hypothetical protein
VFGNLIFKARTIADEVRNPPERLVVVQVHAEYRTPETAVCSVFSRLKLLLRICGLLRRNVAAA